jgi:hypothetical protein
MWLHDLPQDAILALSTAVSVRQPILLVGFIEADALRQLAGLPPHRSLLRIPDTWQGDETTQLAQLFQSETVNFTAPRLTLVVPNAPPPLLPVLFKLPKGWVASTINQPRTMPEGLVAFNLRTKTFIGSDAEQLESPYLRALVAGTEPTKWKPVIETGLRLIVAKAQSLSALITSETAVEETLQLLGIRGRAELDFCISLARADYGLDLDAFQQQARAMLDQNPQGPASEELRHLRERLKRLQKEMLHVDDVRAMLNGITDSLVARGVPLELLTRTLSSVLHEWISFPLP